MIDYYDLFILSLCGAIGGFLAGLLGIGGGIAFVVFISSYLIKLGVPDNLLVPAIIANSMFCIFFAGLSGSFKHYQNKNLSLNPILTIGFAATFASILASYSITHWFDYKQESFLIFFIFLLLFIALSMMKRREIINSNELKIEKKDSLKLTGIGLLSGSIAAFSGIGGGIILMPLLTNGMKMEIKKANGISLGVITLMALLTSFYNILFNPASLGIVYSLGLISFAISLPIALMSIIAAPFGVNIASKLKPETIRIIFVVFILVVVAKMVSGILGMSFKF